MTLEQWREKWERDINASSAHIRTIEAQLAEAQATIATLVNAMEMVGMKVEGIPEAAQRHMKEDAKGRLARKLLREHDEQVDICWKCGTFKYSTRPSAGHAHGCQVAAVIAELTHAEHSARANVAIPCTAHSLTFDGCCLNCGYESAVQTEQRSPE